MQFYPLTHHMQQRLWCSSTDWLTTNLSLTHLPLRPLMFFAAQLFRLQKAVHYVMKLRCFVFEVKALKKLASEVKGHVPTPETYLHRVVCGVANMQKTIGYNINIHSNVQLNPILNVSSILPLMNIHTNKSLYSFIHFYFIGKGALPWPWEGVRTAPTPHPDQAVWDHHGKRLLGNILLLLLPHQERKYCEPLT